MKYITLEQVNQNLLDAGKGKKSNGICYKCKNDGKNIFYYFLMRGWGIYVVSKSGVYKHEFGKENSIEDNKMVYKLFGSQMDFILFDKKYNSDKQTFSLLRTICGFTKEKTESEIDRLKQMAGADYVRFYKLIQELTNVSAHTEMRRTNYNGECKFLVISHSKGSFSIPIENINSNAHDEQIQAIFFNLLGLPLNNKMAA